MARGRCGARGTCSLSFASLQGAVLLLCFLCRAEGTDQILGSDWWLCVQVVRQRHCQPKYRQADVKVALSGHCIPPETFRWMFKFRLVGCVPSLSGDKPQPQTFHLHVIIRISHKSTGFRRNQAQSPFLGPCGSTNRGKYLCEDKVLDMVPQRFSWALSIQPIQ